MAKPIHGLFGAISGKLGPIVGGVWKGIPYLRMAPEKKKGKKDRSDAQIANEQKMTFLNNVLVPFHPFIAVGFQEQAIHKTALSAAYSRNYHQALIGEYPDLEIDYTKFMISSGILPGLHNPGIQLIGTDVLLLSWAQSLSGKVRFDDQVMLVLYSRELHTVQGTLGAAIRRDLHYEMRLAGELIGQSLDVYVALTSFDRRKISDSVYLGRMEP